MANFHVLTARQLYVSSYHGICFELEDLFEKTCSATLIKTTARPLHQLAAQYDLSTTRIVETLLRKSKNLFETVSESDFPTTKGDLNVLIVVAMSPSEIESLIVVPNWRQRYDIVVAYVFDCWTIDAYPRRILPQIDHLFVPYFEVEPLLKEEFGLPTSVLPFGSCVKEFGSPAPERAIDLVGYGRTSISYHQALCSEFNVTDSEHLYYVHPQFKKELFPSEPYGPQRSDYQHKMTLRKMLKRSQAALAFSNTYTAKQGSNISHHIAHRSSVAILGYRWFEISAAGCAVLGRRPQSLATDMCFDWEDSTIELPDDPQEGIRFMGELFADRARMEQIHQRNYYENLVRNDWRHRIKSMLETLSISLPSRLQEDLKQMDEEYENSRKVSVIS